MRSIRRVHLLFLSCGRATWQPDDTAVQRPVREGAERPAGRSVCYGRLGCITRVPQAAVPR